MTTPDLSRFTPLEQRLLSETPLTTFEQGLDLRQVARIREQAYLAQQGQISEEVAANEALATLSTPQRQALVVDGSVNLMDVAQRGVPDLVLRGIGVSQEDISRGRVAAEEQRRYEEEQRRYEEQQRLYEIALESVRPYMDARERVDLRAALGGGVPQENLRLLFKEADLAAASAPPVAVVEPSPPAVAAVLPAAAAVPTIPEAPTAELTNYGRRVLGAPYQELAAAATGPTANLQQESVLLNARIGQRRNELINELGSRRKGFEFAVEGAENSVRGWQRALGRSYLGRAGGNVDQAAQLFLQDYPYRDYLISFETAKQRVQADYQSQQAELQKAVEARSRASAELVAYDAWANTVPPRFDAEASGAQAALEGRVLGTGGTAAPLDAITAARLAEAVIPLPESEYYDVLRQGEVVARTQTPQVALLEGFQVRTAEAGALTRLEPYRVEGGYDLGRAITEQAVTPQEAARVFEPLEVLRAADVGVTSRALLLAQRGIVPEEELPGMADRRQSEALAALQPGGFVSIENGQAVVNIVDASRITPDIRKLLLQTGILEADLDAAIEQQRQEAAIRQRAITQLILKGEGLATAAGVFRIPSAVTPEVRSLFLQAGISASDLDAAIQEQRQLEQLGRQQARAIDVRYELGQELVTLAQTRFPEATLGGELPTAQAQLVAARPTEIGSDRLRYASPEGLAYEARRQAEIDQELLGLRGALRRIDEGLQGPESRTQIEFRLRQLEDAKLAFDTKIYELAQDALQNLRALPSDLRQELQTGSWLPGARPAGGTVGVAPRAGPVMPVTVALATAGIIAAEILKRNPQLLESVAYERTPRDLRSPPGIPLSPPTSRQIPGFPRTQLEAGLPGFIRLQPPELGAIESGRIERPTLPGTSITPPPEVIRVFRASLQAATAESALINQVNRTAGLTPEQRQIITDVVTPGSVIRDFDIPDLEPNIIAEIERILANVEPQAAEAIRRRLRTVEGKRRLLLEAQQSLVLSQGVAPQQPDALRLAVSAALIQPQPVVIFEEPRRAQTQALPATRRQTQTETFVTAKPDVKPDVREITELTPAIAASVLPGVRTIPLTETLPGVRTGALPGVRTGALPGRILTQVRPLIRARTQVRTATRALTAAPAIAVPAIAVPAIAAPAIATPGIVGGLPLPSTKPEKPPPLLVKPHPQRVAFNTGATDLEVNLPTAERTWHKDLPEVPEIPAEQSFTVLERGPRPAPARDFPMGKAHVSISGQGVRFKGRKPREKKPIYESPG